MTRMSRKSDCVTFRFYLLFNVKARTHHSRRKSNRHLTIDVLARKTSLPENTCAYVNIDCDGGLIVRHCQRRRIDDPNWSQQTAGRLRFKYEDKGMHQGGAALCIPVLMGHTQLVELRSAGTDGTTAPHGLRTGRARHGFCTKEGRAESLSPA